MTARFERNQSEQAERLMEANYWLCYRKRNALEARLIWAKYHRCLRVLSGKILPHAPKP